VSKNHKKDKKDKKAKGKDKKDPKAKKEKPTKPAKPEKLAAVGGIIGDAVENAGATYSDGHPQDRVQYLEAKLILRPDRFVSVDSFRDFGKLVQRTAKDLKVGFITDPKSAGGPTFGKSCLWTRPTSVSTTTLLSCGGASSTSMDFPWAIRKSSLSFATRTRRQRRPWTCAPTSPALIRLSSKLRPSR